MYLCLIVILPSPIPKSNRVRKIIFLSDNSDIVIVFDVRFDYVSIAIDIINKILYIIVIFLCESCFTLKLCFISLFLAYIIMSDIIWNISCHKFCVVSLIVNMCLGIIYLSFDKLG